MHEDDSRVMWSAVTIYKQEFDGQHLRYAPAYRKTGGVPRRVIVQAVQDRRQVNRDELERRVGSDPAAALTRLYLAGFLSETCLRAFLTTTPIAEELWEEGELFT